MKYIIEWRGIKNRQIYYFGFKNRGWSLDKNSISHLNLKEIRGQLYIFYNLSMPKGTKNWGKDCKIKNI